MPQIHKRITLQNKRLFGDYLADHVSLLLNSYRKYTGNELVNGSMGPKEVAKAIYYAPFVVLSHNTEKDPVFNYANLKGQELFEMSWSEFMGFPSRKSAEPVNRQERQRLLDEVTKNGFIDNYQGIRISKTGRRFIIYKATVWNVAGPDGSFYGQAAAFDSWKHI